jgi:hypothetical protein
MSANNFDAIRKAPAQTTEELSQEALEWLSQLPRGVDPKALISKFPRIVNRIASLWKMPLQCEKYLDELIFDTREGKRQGFPPEVAFELAYLKTLVGDILDQRRIAMNPNYVNIWKNV